VPEARALSWGLGSCPNVGCHVESWVVAQRQRRCSEDRGGVSQWRLLPQCQGRSPRGWDVVLRSGVLSSRGCHCLEV
jgi:hypothetical protein